MTKKVLKYIKYVPSVLLSTQCFACTETTQIVIHTSDQSGETQYNTYNINKNGLVTFNIFKGKQHVLKLEVPKEPNLMFVHRVLVSDAYLGDCISRDQIIYNIFMKNL